MQSHYTFIAKAYNNVNLITYFISHELLKQFPRIPHSGNRWKILPHIALQLFEVYHRALDIYEVHISWENTMTKLEPYRTCNS
jgi:hypothetical protein